WLDPASRTYLILLTNRVHPHGGGAAAIRELRTRVAAAVGAELFHPAAPAVVATRRPAGDDGEAAAPQPGGGAPGGSGAGAAGGWAASAGRPAEEGAPADAATRPPAAGAEEPPARERAAVRTGLDA